MNVPDGDGVNSTDVPRNSDVPPKRGVGDSERGVTEDDMDVA